nr:hypothetical protein [uncultured bacterium]
MRIDPRYKPLPPEPATLLEEGRLGDAIRELRDSHYISARQARAWVEWHLEEHPLLRVQLETQQSARRRRIFLWFLLVDVVVAGAIIYWLLYLRP